MDWPKLRELAKIFNNWEAWSYLSSLRQLSWEELERTTPALATLPPVTLLQSGVPDHVVDIICDQKALDYSGSSGLESKQTGLSQSATDGRKPATDGRKQKS